MGEYSSAGNYAQLIEQLSDDEKLELIVQLSESLKGTRRKTPRKKTPAADTTLSALAKPMRKTLTLEDLIKEQNYQGGDQKRFDQKSAKLGITEPIEELLAQLTA